MPRFTLKMNVFPSISLETPMKPSEHARFSEMIDLNMPRFTLKCVLS